jgi:hypothetical protein
MNKNLFIGISLFITMSCLSCNSPEPAVLNTFLIEIGVCTSISNANMLAEHGYT